MLLQPDGRIVAWGYFTNINGQAQRGVARLDTDGSLAATFHHTLEGAFPKYLWIGVQHVTLLPDGQLIDGRNPPAVSTRSGPPPGP